ncbi:hypothetical protein GALL_254450 [mine drainage metagenome]|uniref:Uncharacterized protein n=1 Tax=mine drainage metagenome TaxID=410659 RepID=A0A1J5R9B5_9ZZZZ
MNFRLSARLTSPASPVQTYFRQKRFQILVGQQIKALITTTTVEPLCEHRHTNPYPIEQIGARAT